MPFATQCRAAAQAWFPHIPAALLVVLVAPFAYASGDPPCASGVVVDLTGRPVPVATVTVRDAQGAVLRQADSDAQGEFSLSGLPQGRYSIAAGSGALQSPESLLVVGGQPERLRIVLGIVPIQTTVSVTASRGTVEEESAAASVVSVRGRDDLAGWRSPTLGNALAGTPGYMAQETTRGQISPHLRGLTGYQTLLLVDGIRFNTSIFRSGPNQYLGYLQPDQADRIEAVLGPAGATYGSDALGGAVNVTTPAARFGESGALDLHGAVNLAAASADLSAGGDAQIVLGNRRFSLLLGGSAQRLNNLRPGGGEDSRNAFGRYLGLSSSEVAGLFGERLVGTAFAAHSVDGKLSLRLAADQHLTLWYARSGLDGVRSYRDQMGGVGRVYANAFPQGLDFAYARYEKLHAGWLDSLSATLSFNGQKDGTVRGGTRFTDTVTNDRSKVNAFGYTGQAAAHFGSRHVLVFGGEVYNEQVLSTRFLWSPVTSVLSQDRAQYPNDSRYRTSAVFAQDASEFASGKLRAVVGARFTEVRYRSYADRSRAADGRLLGVADSSRLFRDATFHGSLAWQLSRTVGAHFLTGRGFRAPNLNDLGSIGLTTLGYDIPIEETLAARPLLSMDSSEASLSSGKSAQRLGAESLYNFETGLTAHAGRFYARAQVFDFELLNPISGRTLLFPVGGVPAELAGVPVHALPPSTAQLAQGVVGVATDFSPRAVKASVNDGHSRYYGVETLARFDLSPRWSLEANYSFLAGRDLNPNRPARRLPPQQGMARARFVPAGRKLWLDFSCRFAGAQSRLAAGDIDDDRIGASRSRADIASFFNSGMPYAFLTPGPDGKRGSADDIFQPTGEMLAAIQNRVLPLGAVVNGVNVAANSTRVPLYLQTDGWWSLDIRGGIPLGERASLRFGLGNPFDRNYRIHGSGIDAPGRDVLLGVGFRF